MNSEAGQDRKTLLETTLQQRILSLHMAPGALLDEAALCSEFGLSRSPVRELMRQLAGQGLVDCQVNRAAKVAALSIEHFRRFADAAPLIYVSTTQLAAMNASGQDVDDLRHLSEQFAPAIVRQSVEQYALLEHRFHSCIGRIARNPYLVPSLERLLIDHARIQKIIYQAQARSSALRDMHDLAHRHEQVAAAVERHDSEAAAQAARGISELLRQRIHDYLTRQHH